MLLDPTHSDDITSAILGHVQSENEVIRCAAIRALGCYGKTDPRSRQVLLGLLREPDPDVRSDAIEALAPLVQPEDAGVILQSLQGDPVREVKLAAIQILTSLEDQACIPQLRALATNKCEDTVAWEDEISEWDDWLDIQIAAIDALGTLVAVESVDDLQAALNDEMGQTLDIPVFRAFARMGEQGVQRLLAIVEAGKGLSRKRAADALVDADPNLLRGHLDQLVHADDVDMRLLGLTLVTADMPQAEDLTMRDPSRQVRCTALRRFAHARPEWVIAALADTSETVQATALDLLTLPVADDLCDMLIDNMQAWLQTSGGALVLASAKLLPKFAENRAAAPLCSFVLKPSGPTEARIAAIHSIGGLGDPAVLGTLHLLLSDRSQQIRLVALHEIKKRAQVGEPQALDYLVHAIDGNLLADDDAVQTLDLGSSADVGMPKGEGTGNIRINQDGELLADDSAELDAASSTLAALQSSPSPTLEQSTGRRPLKKGKRVAVEGPDAVADDLSCAAMTAATGLNSVRIADVALTRINAAHDQIRAAAWRVLKVNFATSLEVAQAAPEALCDTVPEVRRNALTVLIETKQIDKFIAIAIEDDDALVRADAVAQLSGNRVLDFIADPDASVRRAALSVALTSGDADVTKQAISQAFACARVDTIALGFQQSAEMRREAQIRLADKGISGRDHFVILDALTVSWPREHP